MYIELETETSHWCPDVQVTQDSGLQGWGCGRTGESHRESRVESEPPSPQPTAPLGEQNRAALLLLLPMLLYLSFLSASLSDPLFFSQLVCQPVSFCLFACHSCLKPSVLSVCFIVCVCVCVCVCTRETERERD